MTRAEYLFVIVWIINFIISVLYYLWGALFYVPAREHQDKNEEEYLHDNRRTYLIRVIVMVLCPIVGPLFFLVSHLIYMTIFRQEVDLDDVIFSKERVKTNVKADEERERNLVPIEEALAVSDKKNLRMLMLNVIRGDLQDSLESISLALNSEDSETSHYAASVLRDELNDFRVTVQKIYTDMKEEEPDQTDSEEMLIDYMNRILCQKVFTEIEQAKFVMMMEENLSTRKMHQGCCHSVTKLCAYDCLSKNSSIRSAFGASVWYNSIQKSWHHIHADLNYIL